MLLAAAVLLGGLWSFTGTGGSVAQTQTRSGTPAPMSPGPTSAQPSGDSPQPTPTLPRLEAAEDVIGVLAPLDLRARDNDLRFDRISIEQGLSQSTVNCILQDHKGFMWFGTEDGLNKFDGYSFTVYRHDPQAAVSLSHNQIRCLHEDGQGMIWIGTAGGGLDRFEPETGKFVTYRNDRADRSSLASDDVSCIYQDHEGVLWIGTSAGLEQYDPEGDRFIHREHNPHSSTSLSDNAVTAIVEDHLHNLWVATQRGGLNLLDEGRETFKRFYYDPQVEASLSSNAVYSLHVDRGGQLWVGTSAGLDLWDSQSQTFAHHRREASNPRSLAHNDVTAILEDSSGTLWVGTGGGGVDRFDLETAEFVHCRHDPLALQSLSHNDVLSLYEDRGGVVWVGTLGGGLNKTSPASQKFPLYRSDPNSQDSLSDNRVQAIWEDADSVIWIGSSGGLDRLDRKTGAWDHYRHDPQNPDSLSHDTVWSIFRDSAGVLWIGTEAGLDRLEGENGTFVHHSFDPSDDSTISEGGIHAIFEDREGVLWVGSLGGGLNRIDHVTGAFTRYQYARDDPFSISHNAVQSIHETYDGVLWVATMGGGLNRFDRATGRFSAFRHNPNDPYSIGSDMIYCITEDYRGRLYLGTWGAGFDRFDTRGRRFIHYRESDGLANDVVYGILEDAQGYLWASTNKGLSRFDPGRSTFRNYDVSDGLQSNEFSPGAYHLGRNGELFFGGINGLNLFFPPNVQDNPYVPPVVVTAFRKFDQLILSDISENLYIELSYSDSFIAFEFAALDYSAPHKNRYMYRLEGFDPRWMDAATRRYQSYSNLAGGDYVFRVKGSNNDGVWNHDGIAIFIQVVPPLWDRWWFRGLLFLALVASLAATYRLRLRNVRQRTSDLETQVVERTYEIQRRRLVAEGLREILVILNANRPLGETLDHIASQAALLTGAERAMVFRREPSSDKPSILGTFARSGSKTDAEPQSPVLARWLITGLLEGNPLLAPETDRCEFEQGGAMSTGDGARCALLGLPLTIGGEIYGGMVLYFAEDQAFTAEDVELGLTLVDQAALAIANAQLRERIKQIGAQAERSRLARDLHDAVTQTLFSASLIAEVLPTVWEASQEEGRQLLRELRQLSRGAMAEMRSLLLELRPAALAEAPFADLLRQLGEAATGRTGIPVQVKVHGKCDLPADVHVALYRIAQEALNNVMKHAHAELVKVTLRCQTSAARTEGGPHQDVTLSIHDDGRGFDPRQVASDRLGLEIIRERAAAIGARLSVESEPGAGTTVTAEWKG